MNQTNCPNCAASPPDPLMTAAFPANTPGHTRGIGSVLEVVSASCCQGILERLGPLFVGPSKSPDLIGRQSQVLKQTAERLATVDGVEELLPQLYGGVALAPCAGSVPLRRRFALRGIGRSRSLPASGSGCRVPPVGPVGGTGDRSHRGSDVAAAVSRAAGKSAQGRASAGRQVASHGT
jgi:hypothetical protein